MSRSRKKTPSCTHGTHDASYKKIFNRRVRHAEDIPDGSAYRKMNLSWLISEFKDAGTTYPRWRKRQGESGETDEEAAREMYERAYKRK